MEIAVSLRANDLPVDVDLSSACAIIIDVLRATTVMTTAGANGATNITACGEIERAREVAAGRTPRSRLCGERECKPIAGFDFGNSPAEYTPQRVANETLVLTTTNGTRAINAARSARRMIVASFLNLASVVDAIAGESSLRLVCAGTNGQVTYEDVLLGGAIAEAFTRRGGEHQLDDSARLAQSAWREVIAQSRQSSLESALAATLSTSLGGRNLIAVGYGADVKRCAKINTIEGFVERVDRDGAIFEFRKNGVRR